MEEMSDLNVRNAIGPFPNGQFFIVASTAKKTVALPCDEENADLCHRLLNGEKMKGKRKIHIELCKIAARENSLFSFILVKKPKEEKPTRYAYDGAAVAINTALANRIPVYMEKETEDEMRDCSKSFTVLKSSTSALFPLPALSDTQSIKAACEFLGDE